MVLSPLPYMGLGGGPSRMPPIYVILSVKKGGQSPLYSIRKKNSGKIFGKKLTFKILNIIL